MTSKKDMEPSAHPNTSMFPNMHALAIEKVKKKYIYKKVVWVMSVIWVVRLIRVRREIRLSLDYR